MRQRRSIRQARRRLLLPSKMPLQGGGLLSAHFYVCVYAPPLKVINTLLVHGERDIDAFFCNRLSKRERESEGTAYTSFQSPAQLPRLKQQGSKNMMFYPKQNRKLMATIVSWWCRCCCCHVQLPVPITHAPHAAQAGAVGFIAQLFVLPWVEAVG